MGKFCLQKRKYIIFNLLIIALVLLGVYWHRYHIKYNNQLLSTLDKNEFLIDYVIENSIAYTLVNKKGVSDYGDFFVVFEKKQDEWYRLYENDFKELMPWKIEVADVDGDNIKEILIAVRKTTFYDKEVKNRMFIFNYKDSTLVKKWTGSQIAGRWRDFYVGDMLSAPGDELIFIEQVDEDKEVISIYSWFDFGFFRIVDSEAYPMIKDLTLVGDNSLEISYDIEGKEKKIALTAVEGKLIRCD